MYTSSGNSDTKREESIVNEIKKNLSGPKGRFYREIDLSTWFDSVSYHKSASIFGVLRWATSSMAGPTVCVGSKHIWCWTVWCTCLARADCVFVWPSNCNSFRSSYRIELGENLQRIHNSFRVLLLLKVVYLRTNLCRDYYFHDQHAGLELQN